jgi:hypothetical protein
MFGGVWAASRYVPAALSGAVQWSLAVLFVAIAGALWWRSLDIHAALVREYREKIISVAGRSDVE